MRTLGVCATMAERGGPFAKAHASIEPQLDELIVYVDHPLGAFAKLLHAYEPDTLYFLIDDDVEYPPDYVSTMRRWVEHWNRRAICVCHGRTMPAGAMLWQDADFANQGKAFKRTDGRWVNWPGCTGAAFYTNTLGVTRADCYDGQRNNEETWLACWAQRHRIPVWLVPHAEGWVRDLMPNYEGHTVFREHQMVGMRPRNQLIAQLGGAWEVYKP